MTNIHRGGPVTTRPDWAMATQTQGLGAQAPTGRLVALAGAALPVASNAVEDLCAGRDPAEVDLMIRRLEREFSPVLGTIVQIAEKFASMARQGP